MSSFYCSDDLTNASDLNKIYFMDRSGNRYYQNITPGRHKLSDNVVRCGSNITRPLSEMKAISIPANGYAYLYQTEQSPIPNLRLAGDYYIFNLGLNSHSTGEYTGQKVIDYFNEPNFVPDCRCGLFGTNSAMCGGLYKTGRINCELHKDDIPPKHVPIPRPFVPKINRGYSTSFWILSWLIIVMIIAILLVMLLVIMGVFNKKSPENIQKETIDGSEFSDVV